MKKTILSVFAVVIAGAVFSACSQTQQPANNSNTSTSASPSSSPSTAQSNKSFTASQVAEHNKASDCYISFKGQVYDITSFVSKHPGGPGIAKACGIAVDSASSKHKGGEFDSPKVQGVLSTLVIGTLK